MFKKAFSLLVVAFSLQGFSQDVVGGLPMALKKDQDVFQIVDNAKNEVQLFVSDKIKVKAIALDGQMKITDSMSTTRPDKNYDMMIGYNRGKLGYRLFWSSSDRKDIISQEFDFASHSASTTKFSVPLKSEKHISEFSLNGNFYMLTVVKNSNTVKLYTFGNDGTMSEKSLELAGFRFFTVDYQKTNFAGLVQSAVKINMESPTSLVTSKSTNKLYASPSEINITIDSNNDYTQVITIKIDDFTATEKFIKKPYIPFTERSDLDSNSFLLGTLLYQIKTSTLKVSLTVKDLNDNLIKEYSALSTQPISFKNTDIIQENGGSDNKRILDKTEQLLNKINNFGVSLSGYELDGNHLITLGCVSQEQQNNLAMAGMFGAAGVLIAYAISNPTMENFNAYANRKVVYLNCLFDKNGTHMKQGVKPLAFDKMRVFLEDQKNLSSQTMFRLRNAYYLGYYDKSAKQYALRKFDE